jgi:hypothetical protein
MGGGNASYLCIDLVLGVGAGQITNFMRIANGDMEEWLGRLDNANARLHRSRGGIDGWGFNGRRDSCFGGGDIVFVVLQADIAHQRLQGRARRGCRCLRVLLGEGRGDGLR